MTDLKKKSGDSNFFRGCAIRRCSAKGINEGSAELGSKL